MTMIFKSRLSVICCWCLLLRALRFDLIENYFQIYCSYSHCLLVQGKKIKQRKEKKDSFTYTENSNTLRQHVEI